MNILSLFDGMSCGRVALERAGIPIDKYFASEIDKFAIKIAQKNYPDTVQLGPVQEFDTWDIPVPDVIMGGSPCQGFSFAGHQLNFNDPRSSLFFDFVWAIDWHRPKYFLLENVRMKKEYQDVISKYLGVQPIMIDSSLFTGHLRKRLYWTNIPFDKNIVDKGIVLQDLVENGWVDRDKAYCLDATYYKGSSLDIYYNKSRRQIVFDEDDEWRMLTPIECERLQTLPDNYTEGVSNTQRYKMLGNGWTVDVIAHILKGLKDI